MMGRPVMSKETAGNWQTPQELPDLRRVGIVALDTETNDGPARRPRLGLAVARRVHLRHQRRLSRQTVRSARIYFPMRHPDSENFDPAQVYPLAEGSVASDVRIVTQNGLYDWGWLRTDAGIRMPPSDRLEEIGALATIDRREPVQVQPRRTLCMLWPARQG